MRHIILNPQTELYYGYQEGITTINGKKFHSRINKVLSLDITKKNSLHYIFEIEMFRRSQVTNYMSQAEKDFWNHLAYITDHIVIQTDIHGNLVSLLNFEEINKKKNEIIDNLKYAYKGKDAHDVLKSIDENTTNSNCFLRQLMSDDLYGFFLKDIYGKAHEWSVKKKIPYILRNRSLDIEEVFIPNETLDDKCNAVNLSYLIGGELLTGELESLETWKAEADLLDIKFMKDDKPALDKYVGSIQLNENHSIREVELNFHFSFGNNYKKENNYSLICITEEEIDEDLF